MEIPVHLYLLFLLMATATALSPGPGVVMTLSNALRLGRRGTLGGILGISAGALVVSALSATSLGVLLATSATAFTLVKYVGAAYLVYLGIRLWRKPGLNLQTDTGAADDRFGRRFIEALLLQLSNPKVVLFFLSIFPQFIDPAGDFQIQFVLLTLTYAVIVALVHLGYALGAKRIRGWLTSERGGRVMNRTAGSTFLFFGAVLASAQR